MTAREELPPYYPFLAVTTIIGCSVACDYCPQSTFNRAYYQRTKPSHRVLSVDELARYLDTVPRHVEIHFGGFSEAWLNPACTEMVTYAHARGHRVTAHTTLEGFALDMVPRLSGIPFRLFRVHLPDERMRLDVTDGYLRIVSALRDSSIERLDFVRLVPADRPDRGLDDRVRDAVGARRLLVETLSDRAGNVIGLGILATPARHGRLRCSFDPTSTRLDHNILLPNGDVALCCSDWSLSCVIGNLGVSSYDDIIERSEPLQAIRAGLDDESSTTICRRCALAVPA